MKILTRSETFIDSIISSLPNKIYFRKRSYLPLDKNYLWKIETGFVRSFAKLDDGTMMTLGIWGAGDLVGMALSSHKKPYAVECLSKVEVILLPANNSNLIAKTLITNIKQAQELMVIRSYQSVDMMVIKLLDWLIKKFAHPDENGQILDLPITHEDIAAIIGINRIELTHVMTKLEEQGLIKNLPSHLTIVKNTSDFNCDFNQVKMVNPALLPR